MSPQKLIVSCCGTNNAELLYESPPKVLFISAFKSSNGVSTLSRNLADEDREKDQTKRTSPGSNPAPGLALAKTD